MMDDNGKHMSRSSSSTENNEGAETRIDSSYAGGAQRMKGEELSSDQITQNARLKEDSLFGKLQVELEGFSGGLSLEDRILRGNYKPEYSS